MAYNNRNLSGGRPGTTKRNGPITITPPAPDNLLNSRNIGHDFRNDGGVPFNWNIESPRRVPTGTAITITRTLAAGPQNIILGQNFPQADFLYPGGPASITLGAGVNSITLVAVRNAANDTQSYWALDVGRVF